MEICSKCNQPLTGKKPVGRPKNDYELIANLHRKGLLIQEIAQEVKCSERTVARAIVAMCKPQEVIDENP